MTTTTDIGLRGLALLDAAIAHIEAHPETWDQEHYRCESGMCVAGWACELAGGQWVADAASRDGYLLAADAADEYIIQPGAAGEYGIRSTLPCPVVAAADRAERLLGLSWGQRVELFASENTLADIKSIRGELAAGGLS